MRTRTVKTLPACVIGLFCFLLSACTTTRYASVQPEIEPEFLFRRAEEVVAIMGREPDAIEANLRGRTLVYHAANYLKDRFEGQRIKGSDKYICLLMDENDACYSVRTNIRKKDVKLDKGKTLDAASNTLESILYFLFPVKYDYIKGEKVGVSQR